MGVVRRAATVGSAARRALGLTGGEGRAAWVALAACVGGRAWRLRRTFGRSASLGGSKVAGRVDTGWRARRTLGRAGAAALVVARSSVGGRGSVGFAFAFGAAGATLAVASVGVGRSASLGGRPFVEIAAVGLRRTFACFARKRVGLGAALALVGRAAVKPLVAKVAVGSVGAVCRLAGGQFCCSARFAGTAVGAGGRARRWHPFVQTAVCVGLLVGARALDPFGEGVAMGAARVCSSAFTGGKVMGSVGGRRRTTTFFGSA